MSHGTIQKIKVASFFGTRCIMMDTAQVTSGLLKGQCRHMETWWWNEEVAEAVREKKTKYGNWKK